MVEKVGEGIDRARVGHLVWIFGTQSYPPLACLGIPGITAHRAVYADGPLAGLTVLVHGVLGAVGGLAAHLAAWGGAAVIGTVRETRDVEYVDPRALATTSSH